MRILLVGEYRTNEGPANVNKKIIEHMTGDFSYLTFRWPKGLNKILDFLELVIKLCMSQVVVVSVVSRIGYVAGKLCTFLHKELVLIMHGCAEYEIEINQNAGSGKGVAREKYLMEHAALILPVSEKYAAWVKNRYPNYKDRIGNWNLGYDAANCVESVPKIKGLILAAGGNTPQKNNNQISNAVACLNGAARLEIYGSVRPDMPQTKNPYTHWAGKVPNDVFLKKLSEADIFVVNSTLESFSIALMEALYCGCSILASSEVGALGLLEVEDTDVIYDVNDVEEIKSKIDYLMRHPNHDRICAKLDWDQISYARSVERLRAICEECHRNSKQ